MFTEIDLLYFTNLDVEVTLIIYEDQEAAERLGLHSPIMVRQMQGPARTYGAADRRDSRTIQNRRRAMVLLFQERGQIKHLALTSFPE